MKRLLLCFAIVVAVVACGIVGLTPQASADNVCSQIGTWDPIGTRTVCVPLP